MTVYKGIGGHSSSQSTAMNFDRLAVSLRLNMSYVDEIWMQWLSGRVLDSTPRGLGFDSHRRHCVVVLEQDTFIIA